MAMLEKKGPIVADSVYANGVLVANDVGFTLPGITFQTADIQAMGNMSVPIIGLMEDMEASITKVGIDKGLSTLSQLDKQELEFRWVQNVVKSDGSTSVEGCKAFLRTLPSATPELGIELGSTVEAEGTYKVTRMQIYVGGAEYMCVDRLNQVLRVNGKDYYSAIKKLL